MNYNHVYIPNTVTVSKEWSSKNYDIVYITSNQGTTHALLGTIKASAHVCLEFSSSYRSVHIQGLGSSLFHPQHLVQF